MPTVHALSSCCKSPSTTDSIASHLPLVLPSAAVAGSLPAAIHLVKEIWREHARYAEQSQDRYGNLLDRFTRHALSLGIPRWQMSTRQSSQRSPRLWAVTVADAW
jgi:hypothetical protein